MIYSDFIPTWKMQIVMERQQELLKKIRRPYKHTPPSIESIQKSEDSATIKDYKIVEDGTVRMYLNELEEPVRLIPNQEVLKTITIYKRLFLQVAENFKRQNAFSKLITLLSLQINRNVFPDWIEYIFDLNPILLKEEHYSQPVKEIRRVLKGTIDQRIIDAITSILEFDNAYRFRIQDALMSIDKSKSTKKNIDSIFNTLISGDYESMREKWGKFKPIISVLILIPNIRKKIDKFFKEINLEEIKFTKEDICFIRKYSPYKCQSIKSGEN